MIILFATLLPEKEIKDQAQDYAYEDGCGEGKIDCEVILFIIDVSGKAADIRNLMAKTKYQPYDDYDNAYYNEELANWLKGFHGTVF